MRSTIDASGRLVIPTKIRREAGLEAGTALEIRFEDGRIEIEPAPLSVRLVKKGRLTVAIPDASVPRLTESQVARTRDRLREGRTPKR